ncbi:tyrosine-type recombinase/integrase [Burkholderia territorii]|uniref:tyrosine-type recombinase/integrase n=1 Tax=Burkholderia territorii TaxID=1503055 RepID=UPI001E506D87|nr:site-specific integrase [Burkholderia territorii]
MRAISLAKSVRPDILGAGDDVGTIARLWEQFQETPGWSRYSQYTRTDYKQCSGPLLETFGDMRAADIDATHVLSYLRIERAAAPVRANREVALLSNLIGLAIDLCEAKHNPCREVRRIEEQPRTEAPEPEDFQAFATWVASLGGQKAVIGMAAEYAALAGNRKVEFLDLAWPQIDEVAGTIRIKRAKQRGKKRGEVIEQIEITPALTELIGRLRAVRKDDCLYVFSNRYATHYTPAGFKAMWSKLMTDALKEKVMAKRFTFHDLRAYYVTRYNADRGAPPDLHANPAKTARVDDRTKIVKRSAMEFPIWEFQNKNGTALWDSAVSNYLIPLGILWGG